jgi:hypothetical protein
MNKDQLQSSINTFWGSVFFTVVFLFVGLGQSHKLFKYFLRN